MNANAWKNEGQMISVFNRNLFVIDRGKSTKTLVILHGYPTSSFDYYKVLPELSKHYRVVIHDHLGFGFSDKPLDYSYSLIEQADMALALWKKLKLNNITLLAHDYGTSVATEIIARHHHKQIDLKIEKLILCNGSIHIEYSKLRTIQKLLKHKITGKYVAQLTNFTIFKKNMRNIYWDRHSVSDEELAEMWAQLEYNDGKKVIHLLSNYINERYYFWHRWVGALKETQIPTQLIWAKNDPIAVVKIGELLHEEIPNSSIHWMENCGHFLMLEKPNEWLQLVIET